MAAAADAGRAVSRDEPAETGTELMMVAEAARVTVEPLDDGCWAIKIADGGSVVRFRLPGGPSAGQEDRLVLAAGAADLGLQTGQAVFVDAAVPAGQSPDLDRIIEPARVNVSAHCVVIDAELRGHLADPQPGAVADHP